LVLEETFTQALSRSFLVSTWSTRSQRRRIINKDIPPDQPYVDLEDQKYNEIPSKKPFSDLVGSILDVPMDSIYMTAIISVLSADGEKYQCGSKFCFISWWTALWHYFLLVVNVVIQLVFISFAWQMVLEEPRDTACHQQQLLLFVCFILFTIGINKDIRETILMSLWVKEFPTSEEVEELEYVEKEDGEKELISGIPMWYKLFVVFFVLLPKAGLALLLWLVGGVYLVRSDSVETLILNSVALFFVMEIDEMIWKNLIPTEHQLITIEEFPAMKSPLKRVKYLLVLYTFLNGITTFLLNFACASGLYVISCTSERFHDYSNQTVVEELFD